METSIHILNELRELAPELAKIERRNVFSVPEGYFEGLAANILYTVQGEHTRPALPEGYFDGLADSIMGKIKAQENSPVEAEPLSPVLESLRNINVFEVPQGYFDVLSTQMNAKTGAHESEIPELLMNLRHTNVFEVPQGYFDELAAQVLLRVQNEADILSPQLAALREAAVYEVPQGYFDSLPDQVMARVQPAQAKVVSMHRRSRFLKMAAAAVVTGLMALGVYKFVAPSVSPPASVTAKLTPEQQKGIDIANNYASYDSELEKVSDEDIVQFLESSGTDIDAALVAAAVDENELPGVDEYMLDENALEDFLNDNKNKNLNN